MANNHMSMGGFRPALYASRVAIVLWTLCLLVAVFSFGTVDRNAQALSVILCGLAASIGAVSPGFPSGASGRLLGWFVWILLALLCVIGFQLLPLSGLADPAWSELAKIGISKTGTISVAPADTVEAILPLALPCLMFLTTLILFQSDESAVRVFGLVSIAGGVITVFTLLQFLVTPNMILLTELPFKRDGFSAFVINRNNAATFLGVTALMLCPVFQKHYAALETKRIVKWILDGVRPPAVGSIFKTIAIAMLFILTIAALFLTKSRGGVLASFCGFFVFFVLMSFGKPANTSRNAGFSGSTSTWSKPIVRLALGLGALVAVLAIFGGKVLLRAEVQGTEDGRLCVLDGLISAATGHWMTGSGFGAFSAIFPAYRDPYCGIIGFWDRAHNSYLEAFIGLGIVALPFIIVVVFLLFRALLTGLRQRRRFRPYPAAGIAVLVLVLVHAAVDFSLQIPGIAAYVAVCLALITTISLGRTSQKPTRSRSGNQEPTPVRRHNSRAGASSPG
jgi:hypothetical protein